MRALFLAAIAALSSSALAQHYGPKDKISENDIDKHFCKSSHECGYGKVCERVCLWQEYTKKFVGCKIQCVKGPDYPHKDGYKHQLLPFALPHEIHVPVKIPPPPPKYHQPKPPPPPKKYPKHCKTDYDCGYNMHCTYGKECVCKYGFHPDPHDPHRCIDLKPAYGKPQQKPYHPPQHPKPQPHHQPQPHYPPPPPPKYPKHPPPPPHQPKPKYDHGPKPSYPRTCHNEHDCGYGEKCCYWRKCNAYNICAVEYKCAKHC